MADEAKKYISNICYRNFKLVILISSFSYIYILIKKYVIKVFERLTSLSFKLLFFHFSQAAQFIYLSFFLNTGWQCSSSWAGIQERAHARHGRNTRPIGKNFI